MGGNMVAYLKEINAEFCKSYAVCNEKNYFLIGRKKENDLVIKVSEISRFNCFIATHPENNDFYLFSTSRNRNILYNANVYDFSSKESIVVSSLDALLSMKTGVPVSQPREEESFDQLADAEKMDNLSFFRVGSFKKIVDILPVLEQLTKVEYFDYCIKEGAIKLQENSYIGIRTSSTEIAYQFVFE